MPLFSTLVFWDYHLGTFLPLGKLDVSLSCHLFISPSIFFYMCIPATKLTMNKPIWSLYFSGCSFPLRYGTSRHHDLLTALGWIAALQCLRRLVRGGCLFIGIPCNQWIWLSRGSTFRNRLKPKGCKRIASVKKGPRPTNLVRRICYLSLV